MNDFLNAIQNKEVEAANLFIKNCRALAQNDRIEIARELTDLRVQLQQTQDISREFMKRLEAHRQTTVLEYILAGLFSATLILLGIAYFYI